jgi:membrane protease subunit HflC
MKSTGLTPLIVLAVLGILISNCIFVVREIDRAVVLTFGEVTTSEVAPGLHFKIPGVHAVRVFDARIQTLDAETASYLTSEKNYLEVDSFAKWRISNTALYYTATSGDEAIANNLLAQQINTRLRDKFGARTKHEVVSGQRDQLMVELTSELNAITQQQLGIEVVDVRVKKIDLPVQVSENVYKRMASERQEEAQELRSTGQEMAAGISADADRQRIVIEAEAYRQAEQLRGEGDAEAAAIYAAAFSKDPEFYEFTRSLNAYRETFSNNSDLLLLSPDSDFFKYLKNDTAP